MLKKYSIANLFQIGLVLQGIVAGVVFFLPSITYAWLLFFGSLMGIPFGFYWANRNYISLAATSDDDRNYFGGLESIVWTASDVIMPPLVGALIVFGISKLGLAVTTTYQFLAVIAVLLLVVSGLVVRGVKIKNPSVKILWISQPSKTWQWVRLTELIYGIENGMNFFLPTLIVFTLIGEEKSLGLIQSLAAIIGGGVIYVMGRKLKVTQRLSTMTWSVVGLMTIATVFSLIFNALTAFLYLVTYGFMWKILWLAYNPLFLSFIDKEDGDDDSNNYAYVANRELYLNIGRMIGVIIFVLLIKGFDATTGLRYIPVVVSVFQVGMVMIFHRLLKNLA